MTHFIAIRMSRPGQQIWQGKKCLCVKWGSYFIVHPKFIWS